MCKANSNLQKEQDISFTEIEVIPYKTYKDFQFDCFNVKDFVNETLFFRLRISFYSQDKSNTFYNFLELSELDNILGAFSSLLEKSKEKCINFKEYNVKSQYGFRFGSFWVKKTGWSFFIQVNQDAPRYYPKEKEFKEIYKIIESFLDNSKNKF